MPDTDSKQPAMSPRIIRDLRVATAFLTRFPVRGVEGVLADACWAFPVAGLLAGICGAAVLSIAIWFAVPLTVAVILALLAIVLATGALHEDGLADTADGFGGGANAERKLEIMRDSRSGAYGVLALVFSVGLRAAALVAIADPGTAVAGLIADPGTAVAGLIAAAALSRGLLPAMMYALPLASSRGLAAAAGQPEKQQVWIAGGIGALAALILLGPSTGIAAIILAAAAVAGLAAMARKQIGGYNGDTLGAAQQLAEIAILIVVATNVP